MKYIKISFLAFMFVLSSCKQNEVQQTENRTNQDTIVSAEIDNKSEKEAQKSNNLTGKQFYVCTSIDSQFDNFFNEDDYFNVLFFKDNTKVVHFMNVGNWSPASEGTYKFVEDELYIRVPSLVSGHNVLKGRLRKVTETHYILVDKGMSGQDLEELKLIEILSDNNDISKKELTLKDLQKLHEKPSNTDIIKQKGYKYLRTVHTVGGDDKIYVGTAKDTISVLFQNITWSAGINGKSTFDKLKSEASETLEYDQEYSESEIGDEPKTPVYSEIYSYFDKNGTDHSAIIFFTDKNKTKVKKYSFYVGQSE